MLEKENSLLQARLKALEKKEAPLKEKENKTNPEASTQATPTQATPTRRKKPQEKDEDEEVDEQIPKRRRFYTWQLQNELLNTRDPRTRKQRRRVQAMHLNFGGQGKRSGSQTLETAKIFYWLNPKNRV